MWVITVLEYMMCKYIHFINTQRLISWCQKIMILIERCSPTSHYSFVIISSTNCLKRNLKIRVQQTDVIPRQFPPGKYDPSKCWVTQRLLECFWKVCTNKWTVKDFLKIIIPSCLCHRIMNVCTVCIICVNIWKSFCSHFLWSVMTSKTCCSTLADPLTAHCSNPSDTTDLLTPWRMEFLI